jgi:hypothetical protein
MPPDPSDLQRLTLLFATERDSGTHSALERASSGKPRSDWVVTPNIVRAAVAQFITLPEDSIMKWTKPEAEVVAVTMEVTAYVATL